MTFTHLVSTSILAAAISSLSMSALGASNTQPVASCDQHADIFVMRHAEDAHNKGNYLSDGGRIRAKFSGRALAYYTEHHSIYPVKEIITAYRDKGTHKPWLTGVYLLQDLLPTYQVDHKLPRFDITIENDHDWPQASAIVAQARDYIKDHPKSSVLIVTTSRSLADKGHDNILLQLGMTDPPRDYHQLKGHNSLWVFQDDNPYSSTADYKKWAVGVFVLKDNSKHKYDYLSDSKARQVKDMMFINQ